VTSYVLTADAERDLREIVRYTRNQWSETQARHYVAKLSSGIEKLCAGKGVIKHLSTIHPHLRMARCEHHYVFCLAREEKVPLVIAILHERMDVMARLAERGLL
jgi:plasmid stabilization system protein ParE